MEIYVYVDAPLRFQDATSRSNPILIPTDATLRLEYEPASQYPGATHWQTFHPRDSFNIERVPAISLSHYQTVDEDAPKDMMTSQWLDVEEIICKVKRFGSNARFNPLRRNMYKFLSHTAISGDNRLLWRVSTRGYHAFWINDTIAEGEGKLNLVRLQCSEREPSLGWDVGDLATTLVIPLNVDWVTRVLAFCDQTATLALFTEECDSGCCQRTIHLFSF